MLRTLTQIAVIAAVASPAFAECLMPPVGANLARGCYEETVLLSDKHGAALTLWQPAKAWRGDWQEGDESKDAAVLAHISPQGTVTKIAQWCKQACHMTGSEPLPVQTARMNDTAYVWLADASKADRHAAVGNVISFNFKTQKNILLAKDIQLSAKSKDLFESYIAIGRCKYGLSRVLKHIDSQQAPGYETIEYLAPISIASSCSNIFIDDSTKIQFNDSITQLKKIYKLNKIKYSSNYKSIEDY